jgi:hypothetical protein
VKFQPLRQLQRRHAGLENLKNKTVNPKISEELMTSVVEQFEDPSKEELIGRQIADQRISTASISVTLSKM